MTIPVIFDPGEDRAALNYYYLRDYLLDRNVIFTAEYESLRDQPAAFMAILFMIILLSAGMMKIKSRL